MAEVPEVEVIVRDLRTHMIGRRFSAVEVLQPEAVRFPAPGALDSLLVGQTITGAERRAKHILVNLSNDLLLEIHFMLWGKLYLLPSDAARAPETMVIYRLDGGEELRLLDKLGYARTSAGPVAEVVERLGLDSFGPDVLDPAFQVAVLARQLGKRRGVLKTVLLNQRILSGLGNRDADESMWIAQIDPRRVPASLTAAEIERLYAAICRTVLEDGLALGGTQPDLFGQRGQAQHRRNVFERTGLPCPRCGTPIERLRIGGRNTHYCPTCQI